jgi:hypothetical protein
VGGCDKRDRRKNSNEIKPGCEKSVIEEQVVSQQDLAKAAQRIVLATAASMIPKGNQMYVRDISQAYTQSETLMERDIT